MSKKILMVCLGNICRSPLAHGVFEQLVAEQALDWEIDSAGTGDWHVGEAPDGRSVVVARKYGVDISRQRARQFVQEDLNRYKHIFVMDRQNLRDVLKLAKTDAQRQKITLFLDGEDVPDPYYDNALFEPVYQMIEKRSRSLIKALKPSS